MFYIAMATSWIWQNSLCSV